MPIRPETLATNHLAEPLSAFMGADELAARDLLRGSFGLDVARTYQFWESAVARILDGRLTAARCSWDVELDFPGGGMCMVEVKFSQETMVRFARGRRPVMKFAAPKGHRATVKAATVLVLIGIDELDDVHSWAVPASRVGHCPSITLISPRSRTRADDRSAVGAYRCPPTMLPPQVLRADRAHRADQA